ncbi:alpha/beta fold hydrolase [Luteimonas aquatica]|uniref:alpha/beta fold hydrolase n=1 Tax=Luteimonas aquatica TaxID=450364 RepID=UPI001F5682A3|nr:alpha/beta hydrolase [Luteimonas aquatica]
MNRRHFLQIAGGALTAGAISGCLSRGLGIVSPVTGGDRLDAPAFRAARRFAKTPFGRIAYVERGAGPAALFLHGFPLNSFQWRGALERLSPYRRCIAPDFLGLGHTEVARGQDVGPEAQVAMLVSLLDALGIDSVDLVANDSGGTVAQLLLVRHPRRVRTLLLTNCDVETDSPPPALLPVIELARQGKFADQWLAPWRADKALARSAQGIGGMCYADPAQPSDEAIEMYFAPLLASTRSKALLHAYAIGLEPNLLAGIAPQLRRSTAPARVVWGMGDTIFSPHSPDYLDRALGNSRGVRRLERSKLFWPEERPDVIAEEARLLWNAWVPEAAAFR